MSKNPNSKAPRRVLVLAKADPKYNGEFVQTEKAVYQQVDKTLRRLHAKKKHRKFRVPQ